MEMEAALAKMNDALGPGLLERRCIRYLATIDDLTYRVYVGTQLFGKRYLKEVEPRVIESL